MTDIASVLTGSARWCVLHGEHEVALADLPPRSFDHAITDPPYDARTHKNAVTGAAGASERGVSFAAIADHAVTARALLHHARRWAIAFCTLEDIASYVRGAGDAWVRAGVWDRIAPTPQLTGDRPGVAVDGIAIMHGRDVSKRWNRGGGAGIWRCRPATGDARPDHPTPKPEALMCALLEDFSDPGDVILDPYAGSGTTGVAALRLGRRVVLVERDAAYARLCVERMAAEERGLSLPAARAGQRALFGGP